MNLDFGILWIEDSFFPEEKEALERRVREAGFIARIRAIENSENIETIAEDHNLFHRFDIILLDYKLHNEYGDDIANKIRSLFPSTDILFYSGSKTALELRQMMAGKTVEGVYCCHRDDFVSRSGQLIEQTARSLNRLSGMRGLSMRVVAECDSIMKDAVLHLCSVDELFCNQTEKLDQDVFSFFDEVRGKYEVAVAGALLDRFDTRAIDSEKLFKHFRRLVKEVTKNAVNLGIAQEDLLRLRALRADCSQYSLKVLKKRNVLGHVKEREGEVGWALEGSDEIHISDFPDMRRAFASHIETFRQISEIVRRLEVK